MAKAVASQRRGSRPAGSGAAKRGWVARDLIRSITGLKRAEEALRESEDRFRTVYEAAIEGIVIHENGVIVDANTAFEKLLGYSLSELIGMSVVDLAAEESRALIEEKVRSETEEPYEAFGLRKDGTTLRVTISSKDHMYKGRRVRVAAVHDITQRKRAEEALRESEERYRNLAGSINDVIFEIDTSGRVTYISPAIEEATGHSPSDIIDQSFTEFLHQDDLPATIDRAQRRLSGNREPNEYRLLTKKSGEARWVRSLGHPVFEGDRVVGFRGILTDITERKRAEEALQQSEEQYRNLVETARDVIYTLSTDGAFTSLNPAFESISGWSRAEWLGKPFAPMIHPDDLPTGAEDFRRILRGEIPPVSEIRILTKSGEYRVGEFAARPLMMDGQVVGAFGIVRDITERRRAEEALRESEEKYRELVELSPDAIGVHQDGKIVFINSTGVALVGAENPGQVIGKSIADFIHPDGQDIARERMQELERGALQVPPIEQKLIRLDGRCVDIEVVSAVVTHGGKPAVQSVVRDITERRRAEEALRESEKKYRELVEDINDVIYAVDVEARITYVSPTIERHSGYSPAELIGRPSTEFVHPDDLPIVMEGLQRNLSGNPKPNEYRLLDKSGRIHWVRSLSQPIVEGDRVLGLRGVVTDITERKQAEEALRESEERFRSSFEHAATGMALVAPDGRLLQVNRFTCEILGYSEEELTSMTWEAINHPDEVDITRDHIRRILAGEIESYQLEKRYIHKDGHVLWGHLSTSLVRDADGTPLYLLSQIQDITERKRAEEALRESEEKYRELVENIKEAIFEVDTSGRVTYFSPAVEKATGYRPSALIGRSLTELIHPDDLASVLEAWEKGLSGNPQPVEYRATSKSGEARWMHSFGQPIFEGDCIVGFRGAMADITERKQAEEALRESEEKYRELVEDINDVIYEVDAAGHITYISPAVERAAGCSPSEMIGRSFTDFIHPDDVLFAVEDLQRALAGSPVPSEYRILLKSREVRWIRDHGRPIFEGDRVVGFRGVLTNITERKRMEEALRESEERYRHLVEDINDVIFEVNPHGRITYISPAVEGPSGYTPSDIIGRSFLEFLHRDDVPALAKSFEKGLSGNPEPSEYRICSKSGEALWVRSFSRPVFEGDCIVAIRGVLTDITARKRMEEALQAAREELEARVERQMLRRNPYGLTFRELTVLHLLAAGRSDKEIGTELGISPLTAQKHVENIRTKMGAACRTEASVRAVREGLLDQRQG